MVAITNMIGDITEQTVDVIVNAANETLLGGGGVDGAIHQAAGLELLEACQEIGGCPTGEARITSGYQLAANYVIHTVGPIWRGGDEGEERLLAACYRNSLALAEQHQLESIAFPAISTGVYGYPLEAATRTAVETTRAFPSQHIQRIQFVCFDAMSFAVYKAVLATS